MKVLIFTFCSHQKLKYNYNKNTKVYVSKNEKKVSNVKLKYLLTWQLQHFSSKNELNKTFFFICPYVTCVMKLVDMKCKMNNSLARNYQSEL